MRYGYHKGFSPFPPVKVKSLTPQLLPQKQEHSRSGSRGAALGLHRLQGTERHALSFPISRLGIIASVHVWKLRIK